MLTPEFLQQVRELEAILVAAMLPPRGKILEIGAGAGWQARWFSELGYEVTAVDIVNAAYDWQPLYPVAIYDGVNLPFADEQFDIIFSSNMLEHAHALPELLRESNRVLRTGGIAVHALPTSSWRFWSTLTHYGAVVQHLVQAIGNRKQNTWPYLKRLLAILSSEVVPPRHGEAGNVLSEIYWFSRLRWRKEFQSTGWKLISLVPNNLFYTGSSLLGRRMSFRTRQGLSRWLGSSCLVYVLEKSTTPASHKVAASR